MNIKKNGMILKALSGFYYIEEDKTKDIFECKARGLFRNQKTEPMVGDVVEFNIDDKIIINILKRKNVMMRPSMSNIDNIILLISSCEPSPNSLIIDTIISICEYKNINPILIFTKQDIVKIDSYYQIYKKLGYKVININSYPYNNDNYIKQEVFTELSNSLTLIMGNSGSGKSTFINNIFNINIKTANISQKLGRGKHTTTHIELYKFNDIYIADSPGFSTLDISKYINIDLLYIQHTFIDFNEYIDKCKFSNCSHIKESNCNIIDNVTKGNISKIRYNNYTNIYNTIKENNKNTYK
ncbi:MAG: ribosome small subunit-dependent GTPase A [Oscillospiraceae bacterium]|nr:ribosome small subunit-dependent GTPase A [Oscillospiraceae bacterium]